MRYVYLYLIATGFSLFSLSSCGTSVVGNYDYSGEMDGTLDPKKENTTIGLIAYNTIVIRSRETGANEFRERTGKYRLSEDSSIIYTKFNDSLPPFQMSFSKGELTWQILDSTSVYDKVISKFERNRLSAEKQF